MAKANTQENPPGFITSQEAGKRFDRGHDHIGLLCRKGKVPGILVGRQWLVEEASLAAFFKATDEERQRRAELLSAQRRQEYKAARSLRRRAKKIVTAPRPQSTASIAQPSVASHVLPLIVAIAVVGAGALFARASVMPLATKFGALATSASAGFDELISAAPRISEVHTNITRATVAPPRMIPHLLMKILQREEL